MSEQSFTALTDYLRRIPAISGSIRTGHSEDGRWWAKFVIDVEHALAWHVVQEFGHVLNYLSAAERLPTVFMPVSPPPYINGGPANFLSWVIECHDGGFEPAKVAASLENRLPDPVEDQAQWKHDEE